MSVICSYDTNLGYNDSSGIRKYDILIGTYYMVLYFLHMKILYITFIQTQIYNFIYIYTVDVVVVIVVTLLPVRL